MAKLFQTRDVKMAINLSCVQGARALGSMKPGIRRCSVADVPFEREWLRIGTIDHHQPLTTMAKAGARGRHGSGSRLARPLYTKGKVGSALSFRCSPDGRLVTIFETLKAKYHLARELAHPTTLAK